VAFVRQTQMGAGADEVQAYRQPQDAKALALAVPPLTAWTSRQSLPRQMPFAAAHESAVGHFSEVTARMRDVRSLAAERDVRAGPANFHMRHFPVFAGEIASAEKLIS